ncbi:hypothetical protein FXO38_24036 [Capsicum annuum]|nr:hypothetical protein FXO38_24036 [Capsicum annuum]
MHYHSREPCYLSVLGLIPKHSNRVHPQHYLVDVNKRRLFNKHEPFIMAVQISQVYFEMYPTVKKTVSKWLVVFPIKKRFVVDIPIKVEQPHTLNDPFFQEDDSQIHEIDIDENEILNTLNDPDGILIDIEEEEEEEKEEEEEEKEGDGGEENENDEDEDEDEYKDKDRDGDENEDRDEDDEEEEEEDEC